MTVGSKLRAKRNRKRMAAVVCDVSGVVISAPHVRGEQRATPAEDARLTVATARLRRAGLDDTHDARRAILSPLYGTPHGALRATGTLTEAQFQAGEVFATDTGTFDAEMGLPRRTPAGGAYGEAYGGGTRIEDVAAVRIARARYADACRALATSGPRCIAEVFAVCIHLRDDPPPHVETLRRGLAALAAHYGPSGRLGKV